MIKKALPKRYCNLVQLYLIEQMQVLAKWEEPRQIPNHLCELLNVSYIFQYLQK